MKFRVFIPSRGRATTCTTPHVLAKEKIPFVMVVEPREAKAYKDTFEKVVVLPEDDRGLWFARNFMKTYSRWHGDAYHWQIDDNVKCLNDRSAKDKNPRKVLEQAEGFTTRYTNVGIAGLRHSMFAFTAKAPVSINQQCCSVVLVRNDVKAWWRPDVQEDTDYSMQVLTLGLCTMVFNVFTFDKPPQATMKGGCTEIEYGNDGKLRRSKGLMRLWPGCFESNKTTGAAKPSRVWRKFPQIPIRKDGVIES